MLYNVSLSNMGICYSVVRIQRLWKMMKYKMMMLNTKMKADRYIMEEKRKLPTQIKLASGHNYFHAKNSSTDIHETLVCTVLYLKRKKKKSEK